ncbi:MAG: YicC family protein [Aquificae bacterium]|nr:YicC family protein [Aquificota bacterium]
MTGFGKGEAESENWRVTVMLRSLNGKGLDVSLRLPPYLLPLEKDIKDLIKKFVKRGTVTVFLDVESKQVRPPVDPEKLKATVELLKSLTRELGLSPTDDKLLDYAWRYSEKAQTEPDEELKQTLLKALEQALRELVESRKREGEALKQDLLERVERIERILAKIEQEKDRVAEKIKQKVLERARALNLPEEHPTVINELLFLLEKYDVNEEITRLKTHLSRFRQLLEQEGEVGKKLEFLAQEMHREITTLGNKIPELSEFVVEIKSEIDKIKQQVANVE